MKTAGRITATLALLLGFYILNYWLLVRKGWATQILGPPRGQFAINQLYSAIDKAFRPIARLDHYLNTVVPIRSRVTGHWSADGSSDFVTFDSTQECRFQLGTFTISGKAEYNTANHGFIMEFLHNGKRHQFCLRDLSFTKAFGMTPPAFPSDGQVNVFVGRVTHRFQRPTTEYKATLTKYLPSAPAPTSPSPSR
jgi:hypothetical protein